MSETGQKAVDRAQAQAHVVQQRREYHHGRTPAAWTSSIMAAVGFLISTVGFLMNINWPVVGVGLAIVVVSPIVGGVMRKMGYGQE